MVAILKYNKIMIYHTIYIKVFSDGTVLYLTVSIDDVINTTNNEKEFSEPTRVFEEQFEMKFQEGCILKYLNLRIFQSPLVLSVDKTDRIMELLNEWFPTGKFIKFDITFRKDYIYEKELVDVLPLIGNALLLSFFFGSGLCAQITCSL